MNLSDKVLPLYHILFGTLPVLELPDEFIATCDDCPHTKSPKSPFVNVKCCNYHPHLPNYLAGAVLSDESAGADEGRRRVAGQIENRAGVTPYGIIPPLPEFRRAQEYASTEFWSRPREIAEAQECPYYHDSRCSIWNYRENLCMTYFCATSGGKAGESFWGKVGEYLQMTETLLSQYALLRLGWPVEKIRTGFVTTTTFNLEDESGKLIEENYRKAWGEWIGREKELYIGCYEIVKDIDAATFHRIAGLKGEILEAAIKEKHKKISKNVMSERMILDPSVVTEETGDGKIRLILGGSVAEAPAVILPLVKGFNGKHSTVEIFHQGFKVLYNMTGIVDEMRAKGMLKSVEEIK